MNLCLRPTWKTWALLGRRGGHLEDMGAMLEMLG